jgi:hypothetical protein
MPSRAQFVDDTMASCDGGGALGHPKVYLNLAPSEKAECPYCSRLFVNRAMTAGSESGEPATASASSSQAGAQSA